MAWGLILIMWERLRYPQHQLLDSQNLRNHRASMARARWAKGYDRETS